MRIPLMRPELNDEMVASAVHALRNENFLRGESVEEFERDFAEYIGVKYAIAVNSGTSALQLSLIAMGVKKGDCVITSPATFIATANAIAYLGARPAFVDISLDTYTIDTEELERCIRRNRRKAKVVIPVHLYGYPCKMDEIIEISERYGIKIMEDACQAHGAAFGNRKVGSFGAAAAFSFYPSKNMTVCGDGGMITTDDYGLAEKVRSLRDGGRRKGEAYVHDSIGFSARMNTVNAAIGKIQLKYLERWNRLRSEISEVYGKELYGAADLTLPPAKTSKATPVWHLYVIRTIHRDLIRKYLENKEIQCGIHYPIPVHLQTPYKEMGFDKGMFPRAEEWATEVMSLPMYPGLSRDETGYIIENIREFHKKVI